MDRKKVSELIAQLGADMDLQRVLEGAGMAPRDAVRALKSGDGRTQLKALRLLARIHIDVLAQRWGPLALSKLCHVLADDKKPELQMKGAMALLSVAGLDERGGRVKKGGKKTTAAEKLPPVDSARMTELLRAMAEVLTNQRRKAAMGPAPR